MVFFFFFSFLKIPIVACFFYVFWNILILIICFQEKKPHWFMVMILSFLFSSTILRIIHLDEFFFNTLWNINSKYLCICDSKIMCSLIWYDIVLNRYGSSIDFEFACCFLLIVRRKEMFQTLQFTQFILCCISIIHWKKTFIFYVICYGWFSSKYFLAAKPYHFGNFGIFFMYVYFAYFSVCIYYVFLL